jgi:hypothetical protein
VSRRHRPLPTTACAARRPILLQPTCVHFHQPAILKAQGGDAPASALNYVVKGKMIGGFALVAWPAEYGVSGVKTFIVIFASRLPRPPHRRATAATRTPDSAANHSQHSQRFRFAARSPPGATRRTTAPGRGRRSPSGVQPAGDALRVAPRRRATVAAVKSQSQHNCHPATIVVRNDDPGAFRPPGQGPEQRRQPRASVFRSLALLLPHAPRRRATAAAGTAAVLLHRLATVVSGIDGVAFRRRSNTPNLGAWPRTGFVRAAPPGQRDGGNAGMTATPWLSSPTAVLAACSGARATRRTAAAWPRPAACRAMFTGHEPPALVRALEWATTGDSRNRETC